MKHEQARIALANAFGFETPYGKAITLNNAVGYCVGHYAHAACAALGIEVDG